MLELNFAIGFNGLDEKNALENLRNENLRGHMKRSRAQRIEEGENPSRYRCKLESQNFYNKISLKQIEMEGTGMIYEQSEVLEQWKNFDGQFIIHMKLYFVCKLIW